MRPGAALSIRSGSIPVHSSRIGSVEIVCRLSAEVGLRPAVPTASGSAQRVGDVGIGARPVPGRWRLRGCGERDIGAGAQGARRLLQVGKGLYPFTKPLEHSGVEVQSACRRRSDKPARRHSLGGLAPWLGADYGSAERALGLGFLPTPHERASFSAVTASGRLLEPCPVCRLSERFRSFQPH